MNPSIHENDISVVLNKKYAHISYGDVVIFYHNNRLKIKRVVSKKNKNFFVLGDNMNKSTDSRDFGLVGEDQIIGKTLRVFHLHS